jgi:predicted RNA binding protein YcfA (HicA-like mRNA interferase family)
LSRTPSVTPARLVRALERKGFATVRTKGSHRVMRRGQVRVTVPMHGRDIPRGTLRGIMRDAGLEPDDL